jgi:hypothetical protein
VTQRLPVLDEKLRAATRVAASCLAARATATGRQAAIVLCGPQRPVTLSRRDHIIRKPLLLLKTSSAASTVGCDGIHPGDGHAGFREPL